MSSEALPAALSPLLTREVEESGRLLEILKQGQGIFSGRDAAAIQQTAESILQLFQTVESLESERRQLLHANGLPDGRDTMERLLADDPSASDLWRKLLDQAVEIQKQNEINARIIEGSRQHAEAAFNLLRGKEPAGELYSAKGRTQYGGGGASRTIAKA